MGAPAGEGGGRFAPSPTGPLHLGSLLAAAASYLDARQRQIPWRVRFDDLDRPRNQPGAERAILTSLERHGLHWDGPVVRQSERLERYQDAIAALAAQGMVFYCRCSRSTLKGELRYPGTCRSHTEPRAGCAIRVRVDAAEVGYQDLVQCLQHQTLAALGGDFVIRRRDGIIAYQLATAVDDGADDVTRVIRGRDLLATTPRQIFLMGRLGLAVPAYGHIPLLLNPQGQKLSKQNLAPPLDDADAPRNLARVLALLGLEPDAAGGDCAAMLAAAVPGFSLSAAGRADHHLGPKS